MPHSRRQAVRRRFESISSRLIQSTILDFRLRLLLLAALTLPFILLGGLVHALASGHPWTTSAYLVYGLLFRVPALGAVRLDEPPASAAVLNAVFLFGTFGFAILIGLIGEEVKGTVKALRAGGTPLDLYGHVVLLNFTADATAVALLRQVAEDVGRPGSPLYGRPVAILAARPPPAGGLAGTPAAAAARSVGDVDVESAMRRVVADALQGRGRCEWHLRVGASCRTDDLARVCAATASYVVLLADPRVAASGDAAAAGAASSLQAQALMCLTLSLAHLAGPHPAGRKGVRGSGGLAGRSGGGGRSRPPHPTVVIQSPADAHQPLPLPLPGVDGGGGPISTLRAVLAAEGQRAQVVEVRDRGIVDRLVAQTVLQPGVATVLARLFGGSGGEKTGFVWVEWAGTGQATESRDAAAAADGGGFVASTAGSATAAAGAGTPAAKGTIKYDSSGGGGVVYLRQVETPGAAAGGLRRRRLPALPRTLSYTSSQQPLSAVSAGGGVGVTMRGSTAFAAGAAAAAAAAAAAGSGVGFRTSTRRASVTAGITPAAVGFAPCTGVGGGGGDDGAGFDDGSGGAAVVQQHGKDGLLQPTSLLDRAASPLWMRTGPADAATALGMGQGQGLEKGSGVDGGVGVGVCRRRSTLASRALGSEPLPPPPPLLPPQPGLTGSGTPVPVATAAAALGVTLARGRASTLLPGSSSTAYGEVRAVLEHSGAVLATAWGGQVAAAAAAAARADPYARPPLMLPRADRGSTTATGSVVVGYRSGATGTLRLNPRDGSPVYPGDQIVLLVSEHPQTPDRRAPGSSGRGAGLWFRSLCGGPAVRSPKSATQTHGSATTQDKAVIISADGKADGGRRSKPHAGGVKGGIGGEHGCGDEAGGAIGGGGGGGGGGGRSKAGQGRRAEPPPLLLPLQGWHSLPQDTVCRGESVASLEAEGVAGSDSDGEADSRGNGDGVDGGASTPGGNPFVVSEDSNILADASASASHTDGVEDGVHVLNTGDADTGQGKHPVAPVTPPGEGPGVPPGPPVAAGDHGEPPATAAATFPICAAGAAGTAALSSGGAHGSAGSQPCAPQPPCQPPPPSSPSPPPAHQHHQPGGHRRFQPPQRPPPAPPCHIIVISRTAAAVRDVVAGLQEFAPAGSTIALVTQQAVAHSGGLVAGMAPPSSVDAASAAARGGASNNGSNGPSATATNGPAGANQNVAAPAVIPAAAPTAPGPVPPSGNAVVLPCTSSSWPVGEEDLVLAGLSYASAVLVARDVGLQPLEADATAMATVLQLYHTLTDPTRSPLRRWPYGGPTTTGTAVTVTAAIAAAAAAAAAPGPQLLRTALSSVRPAPAVPDRQPSLHNADSSSSQPAPPQQQPAGTASEPPLPPLSPPLGTRPEAGKAKAVPSPSLEQAPAAASAWVEGGFEAGAGPGAAPAGILGAEKAPGSAAAALVGLTSLVPLPLHVVVCLHGVRARDTLRMFLAALNAEPPFTLEALVPEEYRALLLAGVVRQPQSHAILTDLLSDRPGAPEVYLVPPARLLGAIPAQPTHGSRLDDDGPALHPCGSTGGSNGPGGGGGGGGGGLSCWTFGDVAAAARAYGCTAIGVLRSGAGGAAASGGAESGGAGGLLQLAPPADVPLELAPGDRLVVLAADPV